MNKILILSILMIYNIINAQNILINSNAAQNLVDFSPNLCVGKKTFINLAPAIAVDYYIDNKRALIYNGGSYEYNFVNNSLNLLNNIQFYGDIVDITMTSKERLFYTTKPEFTNKYRLYEINLKSNTTKSIFVFPDSVDYAITTDYHEKLLMIDFQNHIIEMNPDDTSSFKILFTLPQKYLGHVFYITHYEDCNESSVYLMATFTPGLFKIDFANKDLIQVCNYDFYDSSFAASPHPYLSCLDLDRNNSTIKTEKDYKINLCQSGTVPICDQDIAVKTRPGYADSLHIWLDKGLQDIGNETITYLGKTPLGVTKKQNVNDIWFYFPKNFEEDSISNIIKNMRYTNSKPMPTVGLRAIKMYLYTDKTVSDPAIAFINVGKNKQTQQNITTCKGKILTINGLDISKDTSFCEKMLSLEGCDSTHCITVKFENQVESSENKQICFGEKYIFKSITYSKSGVYKDTLKSSQSCDSIVTYTFTVLAKKEGIKQVNICSGTSYDFYGQNLTQSGNYEYTIKNAAACDSTVKLTLSVLPKKEGTKQANICSGTSYDFYGQNLTQSGNYEHIIKNAAACDSTVKLTLSVLPKKEGTKQANICNGTSYDFYGQNLTQSGDYEHIIKNAAACDSTVKLTLSILPKKESIKQANICNGTSYDFYGQNLTQSGNYEHIIKNAAACDSTVKLTLSVLPKKESTKQANICNGTSYDFYGQNLTQSGNYEHIIKNATACDSTVKLTLSVLPKKESTKQVRICEGTTYDFYSTILSKSGAYEKIFKTKNNCDSLEKLLLEISPLPMLTLPADITLSEGTSTTIKVTVKGDSLKSIAWLPATFLDKNDSAEVTITPTESIDYQVVVKNKNYCEAKATIKVFVKGKKKVFAPTAFSPNDDGFNDFFEVFLKAGEGRVEQYEIYDRWGNLIYKNVEPWNGADASLGIFIYKINIKWDDGKTTTLSGEVLLSK